MNPEGGVTLQRILDMQSTIAALGGAPDATAPDREIAAKAIGMSQAMSARQLTTSPVSLVTTREGYDSAVETLQKPVQVFNFNEMAADYGLPQTNGNYTTRVDSFNAKMAAAELMVRAGTNVVVINDGGWDTHGDRTATNVRTMMNNRILNGTQNGRGGLRKFIARMMNIPDYNVVVAILGDFARSLPGSDHASALSATVIGKYVRVGTTGRMSASVNLPNGGPSVPQFWAYLAKVSKVPTEPFGANPHNLVL